MIKTIIFDRHGVFDKVTGLWLRKKIASHTKYRTESDIKELLAEARLQYDLGIVSPSDFRGIVKDICQLNEEQVQDCRIYLNTIQPTELRDIIPILEKSYTLGILSDCPKDKKDTILKQYNNLPQFSYKFRSCDYTKSKSQWKDFFEMMYMYLHEDQKVENPTQILFVDDTLSNVQHAQHLEMASCHFRNIDDLKKFIHR
jgi:FMN phosphatase YigB (HAD superfamily)